MGTDRQNGPRISFSYQALTSMVRHQQKQKNSKKLFKLSRVNFKRLHMQPAVRPTCQFTLFFFSFLNLPTWITFPYWITEPMHFLVSDSFCFFSTSEACWKKKRRNENKCYKSGVINDPLGQPTVPSGSNCRLILKFWDGRTDTRTDGHSEWKQWSLPAGTVVGLVDQYFEVKKEKKTSVTNLVTHPSPHVAL